MVRPDHISVDQNKLTRLLRNVENVQKIRRNQIVKDKLPRLPAKIM